MIFALVSLNIDNDDEEEPAKSCAGADGYE